MGNRFRRLHLRITFLLEAVAAQKIGFIFRLERKLRNTGSAARAAPVSLEHLTRSMAHARAIVVRFTVIIITGFAKDFATWGWLKR